MTPIPNKDDVKEAMENSFSRYHVPELRDFLRRCNLPVGGNRDVLVKGIHQNLAQGTVSLERAFDYIDEISENGEQHVFLFRIKRERRSYLDRLKDLNYVWERVSPQAGFSDQTDPPGDREEIPELYKPRSRECLFFSHKMIAELPSLVAVYRRPEPQDTLFFKWVETRYWARAVQDGNRIMQMKTFSERSVNFLCINLESGGAEIRIQKLNPNPEKALREELNLYRQLADQVVEFDAFIPLPVEPAIRRLLSSKEAKVVRWKVKWIDVGNLSGGIDPGFVRNILKRFGNYTGVRLAADWLFDQNKMEPRKIRAKLDGQTNQVELPNRCFPEEAHEIILDIRKARMTKLRNPKLDSIARKNESYRPVVQQIDAKLSIDGNDEIVLERVAKQVWFSEEETVRVCEKMVAKYPENFQIKYFVTCPETGKPVSDEKGPSYFDRKDQIPHEIPCLHAKGKGSAMHKTEGRIETLLISQQAVQDYQLIPRIANVFEKKVGKRHIAKLIKAFSYILFAIIYVPLVSGTAWLFLRLGVKYPGGELIIYPTFSLVLLFQAGIVVAILGKPLTETARDILLSLASLYEKKRASVDSEYTDTIVRKGKKDSK